jgi:hypothetical protein
MHERAGDDEMIEHADIHEAQRLDERLRQPQVGFARFRQAGRVIVRQDHAGSIARQGFDDDFARVDARLD